MEFLDLYNHIISAVTFFAFDVIGKRLSSQVGTIAFNGIILYSRYSERLKKQINYIERKYPVICDFVYVTGYCYQYIKNTCLNRRVPPFYNVWFSVSHVYFRMPEIKDIFDSVKLVCILQEEFIHLNSTNHLICDENGTHEERAMQQWHKTTCSLMKQNELIYDGLVAFQNAEAIIYRVCRPGLAFSDFSYTASNAKFLTIEVYLPNNKKSYAMDLTPNEYIVNNELFSPCFIKRYFEYHIGKNIFDIDYTVKILDNDICSVELKKNQYIVLGEETYSVKEI